MAMATRCLCLLLIAAPGLALAQSAANEQASQLAELLDLAGWSPKRVDALATEVDPGYQEQVERIGLSLRLQQFEPVLRAAAKRRQDRARRVAGTLLEVTTITLREEDAERLGLIEFYVCRIRPRQSTGTIAHVMLPALPKSLATAGDTLQQPVEFVGLELTPERRASGAGKPAQNPPAEELPQDNRLLVAPRLAWLPQKPSPGLVNFGESVLGGLGYDIGMLDQLTDGKALLAEESEAFYQLLAAVKQTGAHQLSRFARSNLPRYAEGWRPELATNSLARVVVELADEKQYSVAPLFNDALSQRGELFVFDGLVRRAVRIDATDSNIAQQLGVDHYFELELFTEDSQNLPLVFCVLQLPPGFPTGDTISQDARLSGFFLKRWAYRTRKQAVGPAGQARDKRQLAPLLIGRSPIPLAAPPRSTTQTELLAGGGFVVALLAIWWMLWRFGRGDRQFDEQIRARLQTDPQPADLQALARQEADE